MSYQEDFDIAQRYDLLCRASQSHVEQEGQRLQLAADLDVLDKIINHDLPELARSGSPDHFADILKSLNLELEHFREFCEFPDLAQKVVVGVGGAFSAGKSSLINTLLGKKRLVVEIDPTTSLPTYLLYGEQEQITALNLFRRRVILSQDEFASLTHEEKIKYGSQIAGLLRSAFVSDPDFTWKNIALLDTPGYSKPDSEQWSERTDESVARSQLNLSNFIIWVVSATQGTISEDDLKFLATLNADIPKLIVVSRADAKTPEDIAKIVALVKQTVAERGINVLDVIPMSARKKNDYPVQPVVSFLGKWDTETKKLNFSYNFRKNFLEYAKFVQIKEKEVTDKLIKFNKLCSLIDDGDLIRILEQLQFSEKNNNQQWTELNKKIIDLQETFFKKIDCISEKIGMDKEQSIDLYHLLSDENCSTETLQSYWEKIDDENLLELIYKNPNCSRFLFERVLSQPIGSVSLDKISLMINHVNFPINSNLFFNHILNFEYSMLEDEIKLNLIKVDNLPDSILNDFLIDRKFIVNVLEGKGKINNFIKNKLTFDSNNNMLLLLASCNDLSEEMQLNLIRNGNRKVSKVIAGRIELPKNVQLELLKNKDMDIRGNLAKNSKLCESVQLDLISNDYYNYSAKQEIAKNSNIFESIQEKLIRESESFVRGYLAKNKSITENIQIILARDEDSSVRCYLAENESLIENIQIILARDEEPSVRLGLLDNKNLAHEALTTLWNYESENPDYYVQLKIIRSIEFNEDFQLEISNGDEIEVKENFSLNPYIIEEAQIILANDNNDSIRSKLARNINLFESTQLKLAEDIEESVRKILAKNKNITENVKLKLLNDASNQVRIALASRDDISKDIELKLLKNKDVLEVVIREKALDEDFLISYLEDKNWKDIFINRSDKEKNIFEFVRDEYIDSKNQWAIYNNEKWLLRDLAGNNYLNKEIQEKIIEDGDLSIIVKLAGNSNINSDIQQLIIDRYNDHHDIICNLAMNEGLIAKLQRLIKNIKGFDFYLKNNKSLIKDVWEEYMNEILESEHYYSELSSFFMLINIPESIQYSLCRHENDYVVAMLAKYTTLSDIQTIIAKEYEPDTYIICSGLVENSNLSEKVQFMLANESHWELKYAFARNTNLTEEIQHILTKDMDYGVRRNLAENLSIFESTQLILARDTNKEVREYLINNPNLLPSIEISFN